MRRRMPSSSLGWLLTVVCVTGCTGDDPTSPRGPVAPLPVEIARDELFAYFDHLEGAITDATDPVAVHRTSVAFVDHRYAERPEDLQAGLTYLWNLEDADAVLDGHRDTASTLPVDVVREADAIVRSSSGVADLLGWVRQRRRSGLPQVGHQARVVECYFDLLERIARYVESAVADLPAGSDHRRDRTRCLLSELEDGISALFAGARVGGTLGSAGADGAIVEGPAGGIVGVVGAAVTRATAACFGRRSPGPSSDESGPTDHSVSDDTMSIFEANSSTARCRANRTPGPSRALGAATAASHRAAGSDDSRRRYFAEQ